MNNSLSFYKEKKQSHIILGTIPLLDKDLLSTHRIAFVVGPSYSLSTARGEQLLELAQASAASL